MKHSTATRLLCLLLTLCLVLSTVVLPTSAAETASAEVADDYDGSQLWLNYRLISDAAKLSEYREAATEIVVENYDANPTYRHSRNGSEWVPQQPSGAKETIPASSLEAARLELSRAFESLLGQEVPYADTVSKDGAVVVGTPETSPLIASLNLGSELEAVGDEGYLIKSVTLNGKKATVVAANTEIGALYGTYTYLRQMQTLKSVKDLDISEMPKVNHRRLNNWDVERLYAGTNATGEGSSTGGDGSIFCFSSNSNNNRLPLILDRYIIFARMCASVGINEITINNVNADYNYLSESYILMEAALADALRPYGVKIGLSVRYVSPTQDGCNTSADTAAGGPSKISGSNANNPYAPEFQNWWTKKTEQIRSRIPDFIGYTVKANSEGQPGPQDYGYDHGDGAYGMGQALANVDDGMENEMTLFWRTFVYNASVDTDRLKRAYMEFKPINDDPDRGFGDNVFVQTKNGPLDFQGREPVHPMFGAMDSTNQAIELQITQEYTGHHVSLCYLGTEWEEVFKTDTYAEGEGTLVGEVLDGSAQGHADTAIVGVNNIGNSANMTGNHFSQSNFFSFGRQAWDWTLSAEDIAKDWVRMTWSNDEEVVETIVEMMMGSYEALVSYQTPFGVGHQMTGTGTHYFPNPAQIIYNGGQIRDDWSPAYYSRVDGVGVGYNRTGHTELASTALQMGSDLAGQYAPELEAIYNDMDATPENLLLWFHHVPWDYEMDSGRTFWEEAVYLMQMGVQYVSWMREAWASLEGKIDKARYDDVTERLWRQEIDASEWRDFYSGYWQANNDLEKPVDDGMLSIAITLDGKETYQGFDLSVDEFNKTRPGNLPNGDSRYDRYIAAGGNIADASGSPFSNMFFPVDKTYEIAVPAGVSTEITKIEFLNDDAAEGTYEIVSNTDEQAVVKVNREGPFGPLSKTYVFDFVADAKLAELKVNDLPVEGFDPETKEYAVLVGEDVVNAPYVKAVAEDSGATVKVTQAKELPGKATVSVKNGSSRETYTISFAKAAAFEESFDGTAPSEEWTWIRENANNWSMNNGALTITTSSGDIKGTGNNASNILVRDAGNGDWEAVTKLTFSAIPSQATQQGGLVVYQDDNNFIKVNVEFYNSNGQSYRRASAGIERGGSYSDMFYDALEIEEAIAAADNTVWLKLVKEGTTYRAYWATDGDAAFKSLGSTTANLKEPKIAPLAVGGNSSSALKVSYDYLTLTDNYDMVVTVDGGEHPIEPDEPSVPGGGLPDIDFTDPACESLFTVENQVSATLTDGGLRLVSTTEAFEDCNGQVTASTPADVIKIPVSGDSWSATMKFNFDQGGSQGYYEFFGFYAKAGEDYNNLVGIRGGDGAMQDFIRKDGTITAETMTSASGLKSSGVHWFRMEKEADTYICYWSVDGEEFTELFTYEATGIEAEELIIDAYSGMATGYTYTIESIDFEGGGSGLASIDFTDPASAAQFEIINQEVSEITAGEGLYMITTKEAFENCNGQLSDLNPKDVVSIPVAGDWTATLNFDFSQAGAANGYYQFFGFYAAEGEDYQNLAGIRGGNNALQNFLCVDGSITADSEDLNSAPGLGSNGNYWFRIVKEGDSYICYRSDDGEEFTEMFAYEATGIEAEYILIDAYTGMTEGYTFMLKSLEFEGGSAPVVCEHTYEAVVTAPTCTEKGFTTYTCSKCGDSYVADETELAAHTYEEGYCTACGATDPEFHFCPSKEFSDVPPEGHWAHESIDFMIEEGYMNGTSATGKVFSPDVTTSRAMIVQILYKMDGQPATEGDLAFQDVKQGDWFYNAILWAYENGVANGTSATTFNPNGDVTREQIASFLYKHYKSEEEVDLTILDAFPDGEKVSSWAREALAWAVDAGIITGKGRTDGTYLDPQGLATRAEVATMNYRYAVYRMPAMKWVSTWATSEEKNDINSDRMPQMALNGSTVRQIIRVTTSGENMKLKFSNQYGTSDVTVKSLHIAKQVQADKSTIDTSTDTVVTVGGSEEFVIPAGQTIETDPVYFPVNALENVAVSMYFGPSPSNNITGHRGARATTYQISGNQVSTETFGSGVKTTLSWFFLCDVALEMTEDARAIVCFGDSITDGYGTDASYLGKKPDCYTRWGDYFAKRLQADENTKNVAVLNEGIGSNSMLGSYPTDAGKDRYARDLLEHDSVEYVIILFGVNDLQKLQNTNKYQQLITEYKKMIDLAHENDIKVYAAPILPFGKNTDYYSAASEQLRTMINDWFRSEEAGVDAIIDFESAVADPSNPTSLLPQYTSDGLHPDSGYDVMADAIDLTLFYKD